jgi:uncharacterized protein YndB with AHSA1/START domain
MPDAFRITSMVPGLPERVYAAWLDSAAHAAITGGTAKIDATIGGKFAVLDSHVHGRTIELLLSRRIVQTWRAKEFPGSSPDSRLEIQFENAEGATRVTIMHSGIPEGQGERYKQVWITRYFQPMKSYFGRLAHGGPLPLANIKRAADTDRPPKKAASKSGARKTSAPKKPAKVRVSAPVRKASPKAAARRPAKKKGKR